MKYSQPFRIFLVLSLPLMCYLLWFRQSGHQQLVPNIHINDLDQYAIHTLDSLNPISIEIKHEVGGRIIYHRGKYGNSGIILGSHDGTVLPAFLQTPMTGRCLADFHTHADPDPLYDNENFSVDDTLDRPNIQYLETPRHRILKFMPDQHLTLEYVRGIDRWLPVGNAMTIKHFIERK